MKQIDIYPQDMSEFANCRGEGNSVQNYFCQKNGTLGAEIIVRGKIVGLDLQGVDFSGCSFLDGDTELLHCDLTNAKLPYEKFFDFSQQITCCTGNHVSPINHSEITRVVSYCSSYGNKSLDNASNKGEVENLGANESEYSKDEL